MTRALERNFATTAGVISALALGALLVGCSPEASSCASVGADPNVHTRGLGLIGMHERVAALDGRLEVVSAPGRGFELKAQIPVSGDAEAA